MEDRDKPSPGPEEPAAPASSYEPPLVEDLDASYGPSVTAAGKTIVAASPRRL